MDKTASVDCIEDCVRDIEKWMSTNFLKLNASKTEVVTLNSRHEDKHSTNISSLSVNVGSKDIAASLSVRNLGVTFDSHLLMNDHISSICKATSFQLRRIGLLRK